ncbi:unnamed protein product, partial [Didymodactylos carnosus]
MPSDQQQQSPFPYSYTLDDFPKPTSFYEKPSFIEEDEAFEQPPGGAFVVGGKDDDDPYSKYLEFSISHFIDLQNKKKKKKPTTPSSSPSQQSQQPQQIKNIMEVLEKTKSNQLEMITDQNDEKPKPDLSSTANDVNLTSIDEDENKLKNNSIKIECMIEISNLKQQPKQGYIYQLTNRKLLIFISTDNYVYSFILKISSDLNSIKIISTDYVCQNESIINSVCPLFLEEDQDNELTEEDTTDEEVEEEEETTTEMLDDVDELDIDCGGRVEMRMNTEQTAKQGRKCYLFSMKSGHLVLYDAYKSMRKTSELNLTTDSNNISKEQPNTVGYVSVSLPYQIERCVHIRGSETIYVWSHENVYKHNLRDLFPSYFLKHDDKTSTPLLPLLNPMDEQRLLAAVSDDSPQLSTTMSKNSVYSLVALRQLFSLTEYEQDSTFFFAQHNQYWIDIVSEQQQVNKHHVMNEQQQPSNQRLSSSTRTWRLQNCSKEPNTTTTTPPYTHIFDIQTTMPSILGCIEFRYTLNRTYHYQGQLNVTLVHVKESNDVDHQIQIPQLSTATSSLSSNNYDILAGPYDLYEYFESSTNDNGLIYLTSYEMLKYKSKRYRLIIEAKPTSSSNQQQPQPFPIDVVSLTLRRYKKKCLIPRVQLFERSTIDCLVNTCLNTKSNDKLMLTLDILNFILYALSKQERFHRIQQLFISQLDTFFKKTYVNGTRTIARKTSTLIYLLSTTAKNEQTLAFVKQFLNQFQGNILHFKSSASLKWFFVVIGQWLLTYPELIASKILITLLDLSKYTCEHKNYYTQILKSRFGLFQDPFEVDLFDFDLSTFLECCLKNRESSSNGQIFAPQPLPPPQQQPSTVLSTGSIGVVPNGTSPAVAASATSDTLLSSSNIQYYLSKLMPLPLLSSNVYLKPMPGLLEVLPLNYVFHSSSDGTRLEKVDITNLSALRGFDSAVTTITGTHTQVNNPFTFSGNMNNYYDSIYMLPSHSATGMPPPPPPVTHTYLPQDASAGLSSFGKLNKQQQEKYSKLKYITKKTKNSATLSSTSSATMKKSSTSLSDLFTSTNSSKNPLSSTLVSKKTNQLSKKHDIKKRKVTTTTSDILNYMTNAMAKGQFPALYQVAVDRLHSGGRSHFVLDFGQQVTFTDILIPSCYEVGSLSLDFWSISERTDCQRLFSTNQISLNPFYLNDIQPPVIGRYIKITLIGKYNMSSSSLRLPCGYFFG